MEEELRDARNKASESKLQIPTSKFQKRTKFQAPE
jgi:hypothetical protein